MPDTIVHKYWDEQPAMELDNDQIKWIVMAKPRDGSLLAVLQSWSTNALAVKIRMNPKVPGFDPGTKVINAEINTPLPMGTGIQPVEIPGPYGVG